MAQSRSSIWFSIASICERISEIVATVYSFVPWGRPQYRFFVGSFNVEIARRNLLHGKGYATQLVQIRKGKWHI